MRAKLLLCCGLLMLSACGFQPLYATKHSGIISSEIQDVLRETAKIYVEPIANREGQVMRQELQSLLSPRISSSKEYSLTVVNERTLYNEQGIRSDAVPTRITLGYTAKYTLKKGDEVLLSDSVFSQSSYNVLQSGYSTVTAKDNVERQIFQSLAQDIAMRVTAFLKYQIMGNKEGSAQ